MTKKCFILGSVIVFLLFVFHPALADRAETLIHESEAYNISIQFIEQETGLSRETIDLLYPQNTIRFQKSTPEDYWIVGFRYKEVWEEAYLHQKAGSAPLMRSCMIPPDFRIFVYSDGTCLADPDGCSLGEIPGMIRQYHEYVAKRAEINHISRLWEEKYNTWYFWSPEIKADFYTLYGAYPYQKDFDDPIVYTFTEEAKASKQKVRDYAKQILLDHQSDALNNNTLFFNTPSLNYVLYDGTEGWLVEYYYAVHDEFYLAVQIYIDQSVSSFNYTEYQLDGHLYIPEQ